MLKLFIGSNYKCGAREPGIVELILLADFFQVSLDYLVGRIAYPTHYEKKKIIRYTVTESLKVPDSISEKEIERIVHIIAGGKQYSWYEVR